MTPHERAAEVAIGTAWTGTFLAFAAETLPIVQWISAFAAIVASIFYVIRTNRNVKRPPK